MSKFIGLYSANNNIGHIECDTVEQAIAELEDGSDAGHCAPIAVLDERTINIFWLHDLFTAEEVRQMLITYKIL